FNVPSSPAASLFGYPFLPPFDGESLERCGPNATGRPRFLPPVSGPTPLVMKCNETRGASGGPWLTGVDPTTGVGTVITVTSVFIQGHPWMCGPLQAAAARRLYDMMSVTPN